MVKRELSIRKYVIAFAITCLVFFLGLALGLVIDQKRVAYLQDAEQQNKIDYDSLQLQYLYISSLSPDNQSCVALTKTLEYSLSNLEINRIRLESYSQQSSLNKNEYGQVERQYLVAEIQYWLLAKKTKEFCNSDIITVLNFYRSAENCAQCDEQGFVLSYLKEIFKEKLLIFSFNVERSSEPMVDILKNTYGIDQYPTLIVNDEKFAGFSSKEIILHKICSSLRNNSNCQQ
jgi:hypothetical protein